MLEKISNPELKKIAKLHFLVHPGFITDEDLIENQVTEKDKKLGMELLSDYIKKAKSLSRNEVMIILSPSDTKQMKAHLSLDKPYLEAIKKIKEILRDRAIVLADRLDFLDEKETQEKIKKLLKARGYFFDENVLSEAYGEALSACVDDTAEGFNREAGLKKKTVIKINLTSGKGLDPKYVAKITKKYGLNRITYE